MKHLRIKFTSKFEAEYFDSRTFKNNISVQRYDINETDTEFDIECKDIRISNFHIGQMIVEFYRNYLEPVSVCVNICYVNNFDIWSV